MVFQRISSLVLRNLSYVLEWVGYKIILFNSQYLMHWVTKNSGKVRQNQADKTTQNVMSKDSQVLGNTKIKHPTLTVGSQLKNEASSFLKFINCQRIWLEMHTNWNRFF